jgi:hypothetical protein
MHFTPGGLPPNNAYWSLAMVDSQHRMLVYSDSGLPTAYGLAKLIQLAPLGSN